MKKSRLFVIVVVVVLAAVWTWSAARPDATLEVVRPHKGLIRAYVEEQAVTELPHDSLIAMPIAGWLQRIDLREGDAVKKDDVIVRLETEDLTDRVRQAEQRIAVLETKLKENADHRLENHALIEMTATVKAIDETVQAAERRLEAAKAVRDFAQSELERLRGLAESNAATDRELREANMQWQSASGDYHGDALELAALKTLAAVSYIGPKFVTDYIDRKSFEAKTLSQQLEEARAELGIRNRNLSRAAIRSPIDGVVLQRHQTRRQYLQAGTPLLTLGRLEDIEVTADILTQRAPRISPGDAVEVFGESIIDGPILGKVLRVYPAGFKKISSLGVEQQRVKVTIKLDEIPPRLGVAFRVQVRIFYAQVDDAMILPRTALFRGKQGEWQVMAVASGVTELRTVRVGLLNDDEAQVVEGLSKSDLVVARPSREIVAGMRVKTEGE